MINKLKRLQNMRKKAEAGGGKAKIEAQHNKKKYTARERISMLLDKGSFVEIDKFVKHRAQDFGMAKQRIDGDGVVTGYGTINNRLIYIAAQDFTVMGGSLGEMHAKKIAKVIDMAARSGAPMISINDSGGARIQEGIDSLAGYGEIFYRNTLYSGVIPQIALIMGPCAGGAVYSPAIMDFVLMSKPAGYMFITGPQVIKTVTNEDVSFEELGGPDIHSIKSGVSNLIADNEDKLITILKKLMEYIPSNNLSGTPVKPAVEPEGKQEELLEIVPVNANKPYNMKDVISRIVDKDSFFEISEKFAPNIITAFARIDGKVVSIIANNPMHFAGVLDINASVKAARFVRFSDSFNIPIITFEDVPGFLPGVSQEHEGIIRHGAKLMFAYAEASSPKITVIVRKAYGGAYIVMNSKHLLSDFNFAWPTAEIAVMGAEGACNIIHKAKIKNSNNPDETKKKLISEYEKKFLTPDIAAERGYIDDIILPTETRERLISALNVLKTKRTRPAVAKKHGNIPL